MGIDPAERFVYDKGGSNGRPWWQCGRLLPPEHPRDVIWTLDRVELTLDLRTLKLYARIIDSGRGRSA